MLRGCGNIRRTPKRDDSWQENAACIGLDSAVFFPDNSAHITTGARRVCGGCEVRDKCLEYALAHGEWHGIWGGLTPDERREHARRRRKVNA